MFGLTKKECVIRVIEANIQHPNYWNILPPLGVDEQVFMKEQKDIEWGMKHPTCPFRFSELKDKVDYAHEEKQFQAKFTSLVEELAKEFGVNKNSISYGRVEFTPEMYAVKWDEAYPEMKEFGGCKEYQAFRYKHCNTPAMTFLKEICDLVDEIKPKVNKATKKARIEYINSLDL